MSDDIVARLREWDYCWPAPGLEHTVAAAADEIERLRGEVEELRKYQRIAAELSDKFNGTPCAEIRWQQELDAALARAEAAERERDWHKALTQSHDLLADNAAQKTRADAAEAKVAKLREALAPFVDAYENTIACDDDKWRDKDSLWESAAAMALCAGDLRRARAVLQETETKGE